MVFAMHQHESAIGIRCPLHPEHPSHLPAHPIPPGCHRAPAVCAASYMELTLALYFTYGNVHVSMLLSQIIPPSSPTESKICSLHLCLLCCPAHRTVGTIFIDSIYTH